MGGEPHRVVEVRAESSADVEAIRALHSASFPTTAEAGLVDALRNSGRLRSRSSPSRATK
jgi:predicted N-acetyltransferase YhbS